MRRIPRTDESLPAIGLGSYQTFDVGISRALGTPRAVLEAFMRRGGTLVDSSPMYGTAESVIGAALADLAPSAPCFIATKVWTSGRDAGIRQMEDSMRKLCVDAIDLIQVHNLLDVETHLATLEQWKSQRRVRYIGITHYTASSHAAVENCMRSHPIDFVQINYSVAEREAERSLLPLAQDLGIAVIVNRPFAGGALLHHAQRRALPTWADELGCESWAQLALKFVLAHPAVTCAIPATAKVAHLEDFLAAGLGPLPNAQQRESIAAALR